MWLLDNRTPYAAERNWTRDKRGMHVWVIAVKATFDLAVNGRLTLADEQSPPTLLPEYRGDPNTTSLRYSPSRLETSPSPKGSNTLTIVAENEYLASQRGLSR